MGVVPTPVRASADDSVTELRTELNRHDLTGASYWQPLAIASTIPDPDGDIAPLLVASADRARGLLRNAASLEILSSSLTGTAARATATQPCPMP